MMNYQYAHGEDGKCTTELWRERIVTRSNFEWKGACHETLIPREGAPLDMIIARKVELPTQIYHLHPKPHQFSDLRNYVILRHDLDTSDWRDPRSLFYLGNAARGLEMYADALKWYTEFVGCSGNKEDVLAAWLSMCGCLNALGRHYKAIQACEEAMRTAPDDARVYYFMADCWFRLGDFAKCLALIKAGDSFPRRDSFHAIDPNTFGFHPKAIAATAARELRNPDLAMAFAEEAMKERPDLPAVQRAYQDMMQWAGATRMGMLSMEILKHCEDPRAAQQHLPISPHLRDWGFGVPELEFVVPPGKKSVVFYCGHTGEPWGPPTAGTGSGASEKMVVELATRLAQDPRFDVTVYCTLNCDDGDYDGVHWKHSATFNPDFYRDILVVWRVPRILEAMPMRAGRIYVWMHDVGHDGWWTPQILARVNKVLFLSKFQRSLHPSIPEEKVYYTRNGIDLNRHLLLRSDLPKDNKIVFMSSPDRGWLQTVHLFNKSGLAQQGFQLHMFYGFTKNWRKFAGEHGFGHVVELEKETNLWAYEDKCYDVCDGKTVFNRGRVSWDQMAQEVRKAKVWLYPTVFDEISCVAAMEAMAGGCACITTDHAALKETLEGYPGWGNLSQLPQAVWPEFLAKAAKSDIDSMALEWSLHAGRFNIAHLAEDWIMDLFSDIPDGGGDEGPTDAEFTVNVETGGVREASGRTDETHVAESPAPLTAGKSASGQVPVGEAVTAEAE